ncbi:MAG: hypothetical protein J6R59_05940 [Paludibacteraceae bacterium]|nr:hypothetical protein [Paludibacteraceae bacterium]
MRRRNKANAKMNTKAHDHKSAKEQQFTHCQDSRNPKREVPKTANQGIWARIDAFLNTHHSFCFCCVLVLIVTLFGSYLWLSNENLRDSQQKIVESYKNMQQQTTSSVISYINQSAEHRNNLRSCVDRQIICLSNALGQKDSLNGEDIFIKLYADVEYMRRQNEYITKITSDSLALQYRELTSAIMSEKMLELHLGKIEHEYTNITIWAAILTIVFLIFSFFSLFKIEQSRKEIEEIRNKGQRELDNSVKYMSDIYQQNLSMLQSEKDSYSSELVSLVKQYQDLIDAFKEERKS